jgi:hypothetical protein
MSAGIVLFVMSTAQARTIYRYKSVFFFLFVVCYVLLLSFMFWILACCCLVAFGHRLSVVERQAEARIDSSGCPIAAAKYHSVIGMSEAE